MRIVVVGGTGSVGGRVVRRLERLAQAVVVASPTTGVDTVTGAGLASALAEADAVIDVSHPPRNDPASWGFFAASAARLADAEAEAGVSHHLALSIVGADSVPDGYFAAKATQEQIIRRAATPHTILRTTQFYEFARAIADWNTREDTVHLPATDVAPIASDDVATELVRSVMVGSPQGTLEMAGPQRMTLPEFVGTVLLADRDQRYVVEDPAARPRGFDLEGRLLVPEAPDIVAATTLSAWLELSHEPYRASSR